jgi:cold shock CspA family protein
MQRSFNTTDTPVVAHSCDLPTPEELPLKCPPPPPSPQKDSHDQSMIIVVDEANDFEEEQQPTADYHHHHDQQQQQHFTTNLGNPMFLAAYPCPPVLPYYRRSGRVKFFSSQKGYGFIIPNDPNEVNINGKNEIFVHHTAIHNDGGFKSLGNNESVRFE